MSLKKSFQQSGHFIIEEFLSSDELAFLKAAITPIHKKWLEENKSILAKNLIINSNYLTHQKYFNKSEDTIRDQFFQFISSDKIVSLVKEVLGEEVFFLNSQVFFSPESYERKGYWHRDSQYLGISLQEQKEIIHKNQVIHIHIPFFPDSNFEFILGSHKRWDQNNEYDIRKEENGKNNYDNIAYATLSSVRPRDIRLFSAHGIHRGISYQSSPQRFTFDLVFGQKFLGYQKLVNSQCLPGELSPYKNAEIFE